MSNPATNNKKGTKPKNYRGTQSYLTEEQIRMLKGNPNIAKINARQINYTQTFKNYFCREYAKGRPASEILREQGIDPEILGQTRISSLRTYYNQVKRAFPGKEQLARTNNITSGYLNRSNYNHAFRDAKGTSHTELQTNDDLIYSIGKLEQQVQYLQKETEFLKKIFAHRELAEAETTISKRIKSAKSSKKSSN